MLFNTPQFVAFFLAFFVVYTFLARGPRARLVLLAAGSILFYASFSYRFIPVLVGSGICDFYLAQAIHRAEEPRRKRLLVVSVVMNLAVLAVFKYTDFALASAEDLLHLVGVRTQVPRVGLVFPLGISFYTFQSISYTVDVYRKVYAPRTKLLHFLASLTFFPHLVAGPIVRASSLIPQFEALAPATWAAARRGFLLIAVGLAKKCAADLLGGVADPAFARAGAGAVGAVDAWLGAVAFAGQVYGDFSGYTDIALGTALLLGFTLPPNFDVPYLATSPVDLWQRWHMSLTTWIRDYLYTPLALRYRAHPYRNLIITWVLIGLWHGPSWTYVVFGIYYGLVFSSLHVLSDILPVRLLALTERRAVQPLLVLGTFFLVLIGHVLFRSSSVLGAGRMLMGMFWGHAPARLGGTAAWVTAGLVVLGVVLPQALDYLVVRKPELAERPRVLWPLVLVSLIFAATLGQSGQSFIYFAF